MQAEKANFISKKNYKIWMLALSAVLALIFAAWYLLSPSYLNLYIPISSYHGDIWHNTHSTTFSYNDGFGVEYVLRRDGTAYTDVVGWQSSADGLNYIDRWLVERGWERTHIYTEGDPILPESDFLKFGETYAVYTRPEDQSGPNGEGRGAMGRVTIAVYPICHENKSKDCSVRGFKVAIATAVPSFRKMFYRALDD